MLTLINSLSPLPKHTLAQPSKQQRALSRQSRSLTPTLQQLDLRPAHTEMGGSGPRAGQLEGEEEGEEELEVEEGKDCLLLC